MRNNDYWKDRKDLNKLKKQKIGYIVYKKGDDNEFNIEKEYKGGS